MRRVRTGLAVVGAVVVAMMLPFGASAGAAVAPGCWSGQVGLYSQANYKGTCYGFAGTNRHFNSWPGIKDNMRSVWNGGTSYRSCVYRDTAWKSRVASLAIGQRHSWSSRQGAESNSWVTPGTSCPL